MNSLERREVRFFRRKQKREKKIIDRSNLYANLDNAFTFSKVMYYADKCCKGVGYKKSTQNFKWICSYLDFSKFFQNCSHDLIHDIHKKYIYNDIVIKIIEYYLFIGEGIALGVEIAQREACIMPNI